MDREPFEILQPEGRSCFMSTSTPVLLRQKPIFLQTNAEVTAFLKRACPNGLRTQSGEIKGTDLFENNSGLNTNNSWRNHAVYEVEKGRDVNAYFDVSFLIKDETSCLKGNLDSESDVDFYQFSIPYNRTLQNYFDIAVSMELPDGCDYDLTLYDQYGNQVGRAEWDENGKKTLHIPNWDTKTNRYCLKVETKNKEAVDPDDSYRISFRMSENKESYKTDAVRDAYIKYHNDSSTQQENAKESLAEYNRVLKEMEKQYVRELDALHKKQYESLPEELKYTGDKSLSELMQDMADGRELTKAEEAYVKIYANLRDYEEAVRKNELQNEVSADFLSDLNRDLSDTDTEITSDDLEGMKVSIAPDGGVSVSGINDENIRSRVETLISGRYADRLYHYYTGIAESLTDLPADIYQFVVDVQEAERFLSKAAGEVISLEQLYFTADGKIGGLPGNVADLVNKTKNNTKIETIRESLHNIISFKQSYGMENIPRFSASFTFKGGSFDVEDQGFDIDMAKMQEKMESIFASSQIGDKYNGVYSYQFPNIL